MSESRLWAGASLAGPRAMPFTGRGSGPAGPGRGNVVGRHDRRSEGGEGAVDGIDDSAEELDLSDVSPAVLRDRLSVHSDGRADQVVHAATELRASLDRLAAGIAYRREALVVRAGEMARAALPFAGGALVAGVGAALVARRARKPRTG